MSDTASSSALAGRTITAAHRAVVWSLIWVSASLATATAIYLLIALVVSSNQREAGRLLDEAGDGKPYLALLVGAFAVRHGRPDPHR